MKGSAQCRHCVVIEDSDKQCNGYEDIHFISELSIANLKACA